MARYQNGINGPFSGKVGKVVGASWRGIDYMRTVGSSPKQWSAAQINQRLRFALAMNWLNPLVALINIGYQQIKTKKTPLNAAVSYHLKQAIRGEAPDYSIDFSKAIFSVGELLVSFIREIVCLSDRMLLITWDNLAETIYSSAADKITFIIYSPSCRQFIIFKDEASRGDKEAVLQLPATFAGSSVHGYLYFVNAAGDQVSTSLYLGELGVVP